MRTLRLLVSGLLCFMVASCGSGPEASPSPDAAPPSPPPPPPTSASTATLFLNFDGVTITPGDHDDVVLNMSSIPLAGDPFAIPPFLANAADRTAIVDATFAQIRTTLAPFAVEVVRTRPATAPYTMIVFGGPPLFANGPSLGVALLDCGDERPSDLSFVYDPANTAQLAVYAALFALGKNVGLDGASDPNNCMCTGQDCVSGTEFCTFSSAAHIPHDGCSVGRQHDQLADLASKLGTR